MKFAALASLLFLSFCAFGQVDSTKKGDTMKYSIVENKPNFPGCEEFLTEEGKSKCFQQKLFEHIGENFVYPKKAKKRGIQGKVYVTFVIETTGKVEYAWVSQGIQRPEMSSKDKAAAQEIEDECVRVIKLLPTMQPAKQRAKPVRMQFTIPINASLK